VGNGVVQEAAAESSSYAPPREQSSEEARFLREANTPTAPQPHALRLQAEQPKSALCRSKRIRRIKMARTNVPEGQLPSHGTLVPWARGVHARSAPERSSSSPLLRWLDCSTPVFTMPDLHVHDPDPDPGVHDAPI